MMLSVPFVIAIFNHGITAIINVTLSVVTCWLIIALGRKLFHTDFIPRNLTPVVVGITVSLLLPGQAPWWMTILTAAFAVGVCIIPFGSFEKAPFSPAASAICFAVLCWNEQVFDYSTTGDSLGKMLSYGNAVDDNIVAVLEAFVGRVPSAMGTGCILALTGSLIYLVIRRWQDSIPVFSFLAAVCLMALLFPRTSSGRLISLVMELCSGMIFFCAIFFMSNPLIMPKKLKGKIAWGFISGVICMLIRYASPLEEAACFGILICHAIPDFFDRLPHTRREERKIRKEEPYTEIEAVTVVPSEILDEIPDVPDIKDDTAEDIPEADESADETEGSYEIESLHEIVEEENTITEAPAPFITGGDDDE